MGERTKLVAVAVALSVIILQSSAASAYVDPGTAAVIGGGIWPFILWLLGAVGAFFMTYFFKPIKNFIAKLFRRDKNGRLKRD